MNFFAMLFARLKEPSTMAGLGVLAGLAGVPPNAVGVATQAVAAVLAVCAVVMPERAAKPPAS